jgi:hypothetical protein
MGVFALLLSALLNDSSSSPPLVLLDKQVEVQRPPI